MMRFLLLVDLFLLNCSTPCWGHHLLNPSGLVEYIITHGEVHQSVGITRRVTWMLMPLLDVPMASPLRPSLIPGPFSIFILSRSFLHTLSLFPLLLCLSVHFHQPRTIASLHFLIFILFPFLLRILPLFFLTLTPLLLFLLHLLGVPLLSSVLPSLSSFSSSLFRTLFL